MVRIHCVGIRGTDIHAFHGKMPYLTYPRILGHELGVEGIAIGDGVTTVQVGDRCAVERCFNCGRCIACRAGKTNCCVHLQVLGVHTDGGMRDLFAVPAHKLHPAAWPELRATRTGRDAEHRPPRRGSRPRTARRVDIGHRRRTDRALGHPVRPN